MAIDEDEKNNVKNALFADPSGSRGLFSLRKDNNEAVFDHFIFMAQKALETDGFMRLYSPV